MELSSKYDKEWEKLGCVLIINVIIDLKEMYGFGRAMYSLVQYHLSTFVVDMDEKVKYGFGTTNKGW